MIDPLYILILRPITAILFTKPDKRFVQTLIEDRLSHFGLELLSWVPCLFLNKSVEKCDQQYANDGVY